MTTPPSLVACQEKPGGPNLRLTGMSFRQFVKLILIQKYFPERPPKTLITWKTSALIHVVMECVITKNIQNLIWVLAIYKLPLVAKKR